MTLAGYELRRFHNVLYLLTPVPVDPGQLQLKWRPGEPLVIPALNIRLTAVLSAGNGLQRSLLDKTLTIRFRQGGEKFHPAGREHSQSLKKLLQEAGIPPWQRSCIPLLFDEEELIAVAGLWNSLQHTVPRASAEPGWEIMIEQL
jgi:tRNA(Ile)-lysidine synthase